MIYVLSIGIMTVHLLTLFLAETVCFMGEIHTYIYMIACWKVFCVGGAIQMIG